MHTYWTSMLWSIDSCQNKVSADQSHLTVSWAQVSTPIQVKYILKLSADKLLVFKWLQAHCCKIHMKYVFVCRTTEVLISNWPRPENSASYYRQGRQLPLTLLIMVTRWSRFTSNFYALIGQNLTVEFMRKIYAASWILFTLTAEADRVLCELVMFLTVFFHWMYKMRFSCYQESSVIHC